MNSSVKAFLFDLGDIFFEAHYWRKWMHEFFLQQGNFKGTFKDFYFLYESFLIDVYEGKEEYETAFLKFLAHLGVPANEREYIKNFAFIKKKYYEDIRELYPSVKQTLRALQQANIKNIVITDNEAPEDEIRKKILQRFTIDTFIYGVVTSNEIGTTKPCHKIFEYTLKKFSLRKNQVFFVSHNLEEI